MNKCMVLWSGGLDSTVLMHYVKNELNFDPVGLHFIYESKQKDKQLEALRKMSQWKVGFKSVDLSYLLSNSLTGVPSVPEGEFNESTIKQTIIPFRNGIFLSYAASMAENNNINSIAIGVRVVNHGATYPDCTEEFLFGINTAISNGTSNEVSLHTPFIYNSMDKIDIVKYGLIHDVPFEHTWSCYDIFDRPCLKCPTCVDRIEAFKKNGVKDPALTDDEWYRAIN